MHSGDYYYLFIRSLRRKETENNRPRSTRFTTSCVRVRDERASERLSERTSGRPGFVHISSTVYSLHIHKYTQTCIWWSMYVDRLLHFKATFTKWKNSIYSRIYLLFLLLFSFISFVSPLWLSTWAWIRQPRTLGRFPFIKIFYMYMVDMCWYSHGTVAGSHSSVLQYSLHSMYMCVL